MKNIASKRWGILQFILMPALISLACVTLTGGSTKDMVFGSGSFNLTDTAGGLSDLSSYKATLVLSFDGTKAGQPQQWSRTYVMLATKEPATRQLTIEKSGDTSDPDAIFMAEVNGADYERHGEDSCSASAIEAGNSLSDRMEPASFLGGVIGADEAASETVNDISADHYTFDEHALAQQEVTQSTGEMWVASEGGYIVKYVLTTKGDARHFGEGIEGTLTWDYELTDVNQPVTFKLPADCPAGMVDAPLLPDASKVLNLPGALSFHTSTDLEDAVAFYQEQISGLGWTMQDEPVITATTALMNFAQENRTMTVIISVGDTDTKVQIALRSAEP